MITAPSVEMALEAKSMLKDQIMQLCETADGVEDLQVVEESWLPAEPE